MISALILITLGTCVAALVWRNLNLHATPAAWAENDRLLGLANDAYARGDFDAWLEYSFQASAALHETTRA